jgi:L-seryl-tRNA(Ser) seleniumtransferase
MAQERLSPRNLPSVDRLMSHPEATLLLQKFNRDYVLQRLRQVLDGFRRALRQGEPIPADQLDVASILGRLRRGLSATDEPRLVRVVNATGTILHTNLGRAVLADEAIEAAVCAGRHPVNLEYDLAKGKRGGREENVASLLIDLTGAEAACVVNNNAAAVLLALNTLAEGKEVIVSRGELIEIGGSFRIPEIMAKSGAILKEVGTTNRTHIEDYERAISEKTALLLKVHTSNYKIMGFAAEVSLSELVPLGQKYQVPVMEDLGSGALVDISLYGLPREPVVADQIALGADVVTFSGDKILGGPQAGLIVGKKDWIRRMNRNPLKRVVRCGKLTNAALEATLRLYQQSADLTARLPTFKAFTRSLSDIEEMGKLLIPVLQSTLGEEYRLSLEDAFSQIGSGALPTEEIPTKVISIRHARMGAEKIAQRFRAANPPILGRVNENRFLLDLRAIFNANDLIPIWAEK